MTRKVNGIWNLTDEEMLWLSTYAFRAESVYRLLGQDLDAKEAKIIAKKISNKLRDAGYFDTELGG